MPESGTIEGDAHLLRLRVYYEDTDAAGIVYYANYLKLAERARTELLRLIGLDHRTMRESFGCAFAVRRCTVDYRRPARLDDLLTVRTRLLGLTGARMALAQDVLRDDELLVALLVDLVMLGEGLRPVRIPAPLRERIRALGA
jgi:acyl-CoA thioester hydrolase